MQFSRSFEENRIQLQLLLVEVDSCDFGAVQHRLLDISYSELTTILRDG